MGVIPFGEYHEALREGLDHKAAWECFVEAGAVREGQIAYLIKAAQAALHDLCCPQHEQNYETVPTLRRAINDILAPL